MANKQARLIVVLAGVLLAVVGASVVLLMVLPEQNPSTEPLDTEEPTTGEAPVGGEAVSDRINLAPLDTTLYRALDKSSIQQGALPVQPPAATGKANPFI